MTGQGKGKAKGHDKSVTRARVEVFLDSDRSIVHEYVGMRPGRLPPGLAKRNGDLPPGLEKQLRKNGHLPPGLEKKLVPFPPELEVRLAPLAPNLARGFIGGHAVIFNASTRVVLDVFIPLP